MAPLKGDTNSMKWRETITISDDEEVGENLIFRPLIRRRKINQEEGRTMR